jgi:hypothetical protein
MVADQLRYAFKFTGEGGEVIFPLVQFEYEPAQDFRSADVPLVGADYAFDFAGVHPWAKAVGVESVRFLLARGTPQELQDAYDAMLTTLMNAGMGQLWTTDAGGTQRWADAKLASRPSIVSAVKSWQHSPVNLRFRRYSDWQGATITGSVAITTSPQLVALPYLGTARQRRFTFRLRANTATGFNQPQMEHMGNGLVLGSARVASSALDEIRIDGERAMVEWSTDDGLTYSPDWPNLILGPKQVDFMRLEPSGNTLRFTNTGTPNFQFEWTYTSAYH